MLVLTADKPILVLRGPMPSRGTRVSAKGARC